MRRACTAFFCAAAVTLCGQAANAQYYYPPLPTTYGAMPVQYMTPYGNPGAYPMMARPAYYPPQMMRQPMPYAPMPMPMQYPPSYQPRMNTYGPLPAESADMPMFTKTSQGKPANGAVFQPVPTHAKRSGKLFKGVSNEGEPPQHVQQGGGCADGSCGPNGCADGSCGPNGCAIESPYKNHAHARGHYVGDIGGYLLVPQWSRTAFTTITAAGVSTTTNFPTELEYGARARVAYIFHNGWGARAGYQYLGGDVRTSLTNADPTLTVTDATTLGPAGAAVTLSPSASLTAMTGVDVLEFRQLFNAHIFDGEIVKEAHWRSTTFLCSAGVRYVNFLQSYKADRTVDGATAIGDVSELSTYTASRYQGLGATASFEAVQPLTSWGLSIYGNARGSWIWGTNRFDTSIGTQTVALGGGGGITSVAAATQTSTYDTRGASNLEAEVGLQFGKTMGKYYVFSRAGAVYHRWWDIGTPTSASGSLSLIGGTAVLGIAY